MKEVMKKIILKSKIISKLSYIKIWEDLNEKKFKKALKKIEITGEDGISILKLNYIITKNGITLSVSNSLFDLSEKELNKLIKESYKVARIEDKKHYPEIIKSLWDLGYKVIPLDNLFYVNLEENIEIEFDESITIKTEDIN